MLQGKTQVSTSCKIWSIFTPAHTYVICNRWNCHHVFYWLEPVLRLQLGLCKFHNLPFSWVPYPGINSINLSFWGALTLWMEGSLKVNRGFALYHNAGSWASCNHCAKMTDSSSWIFCSYLQKYFTILNSSCTYHSISLRWKRATLVKPSIKA